ncbi:MAG: 30S ribosomal protein S21 [Weeksellaceae bacterium]|jgi:small subunit ribosomal protein S21|nr:30S ribosomal protein S21 [Weeksellaceae bacterium]
MLIIPVKDGESIDKALKKYKRKFDKTGVVRQLRSRQQFVKPSVTKRQQRARAAYKQQLLSKEEA